MTDTSPERDRLNVVDGADDHALGIGQPPEAAPPGAEIDGSESLVPGARFTEPTDAVRPWQTTLGAVDEQAGVANDPPDAQGFQYPQTDDHRD